MASSVQFEVTGIPAITDVGAVIRLAVEAVPTKTEARASKGYVSLSIDAGSTRKFSLSQHYGSNFEDGLTLADVLTPNTKYKLYLYMPSAIDLGQTEIQGGEIQGDRVEISFTTANLPAAGDAVWSETWTARVYTASLNEYHFMENQKGLFVTYFQTPYTSSFTEVSGKDDIGTPLITVGTRVPSNTIPGAKFYFNYGAITGYPANYSYWIAASKQANMHTTIQVTDTDGTGGITSFAIPVTRY
ncbi:hypothetical protein P0082_03110 [Candidatus Haliotispira prima]|uniref:Uncharacterized protein n=1 Tax=Candidatus Haliotispira prima TaxID=3034016 RepID=A0ABY8MM53_9SPIO|nr:hypothetical protein P0082_03110 [Candidatus Haliotispira prima]